MKNSIFFFSILVTLCFCLNGCTENQTVENDDSSSSITLFNEILFFDGYAETVNEPVPSGIYRISNSKYVTKLSTENLNKIGSGLSLEVILKAACDNYDRIGNVFLSLLNKGEAYSKNNIVSTIELARFITPFMDKNKTPDEVPYTFDISNISKILKDQSLNSKYDFWFEFDIFGVPYAANVQIEGCDGKNYTFFGTLKLVTSANFENSNNQSLISLASFENFNNYRDTDEMGTTKKTLSFDTSSLINNAKLYLITSNHGAQSGGEEYKRRTHYIYFNENLLDSYKPGGESCEPFRVYNTQSNGIYGKSPRSTENWSSWNNWCPGNVIPIRIYDLGNLAIGNHSFRIEVPEAEFVGQDGNFPLSVYIQGDL